MAEIPKVKHIHILSICGQGMTTPIALYLKKQGYLVTGSDQQQIYPPASTLLKNAKIPVNKTPISLDIGLVIIGSSFNKFSKTIKDFELIKKLKIPYISATEFVRKYIIKKNSIVVAGSYGKTTTTGLLAWILSKSALRPSFLVGGRNIDASSSLTITGSTWSVVEGDESINGLDTQAKFLYFKPKYVIITSAFWEHRDSYPTKQHNLDAYKKLIQQIPQDGFLVYNKFDSDLVKLAKYCQAPTYPTGLDLTFDSRLVGDHNQLNINLAFKLCTLLGLDTTTTRRLIQNYQGIERRLQLVGQYQNIKFFDDFAQSPPRLQSAIMSLKQKYSESKIKVFFEPHASFLSDKSLIGQLNNSFKKADLVVLSKINYQKTDHPKDRVTFADFKTSIGSKTIYLPLSDQLESFFVQNLQANDILIHFSSGGLKGLQSFQNIINSFKSLDK